MMTFKTALILFIAINCMISIFMIVNEIIETRAERKEKEREMRNRDMVARDERLKRELIEHNRQQLALEYLCDKGENSNESA